MASGRATTTRRRAEVAAGVWLDAKLAFQGWHRTLVAICALADAARDADWLESAGVCQIEVIGIDKGVGVAHLAAQSDGKAARGRAICAPGFRDIARQADIAHAIGGFGQLPQKPPRRFKGPVHIPQRAGATKAGKLQARGGMAFGDRARLVYADKEERDAFVAGSL